MRVKLSLAGDMCMPQPLMLSCHYGWHCLEIPTPVVWPPGFALQQNKLTKKVFHQKQFMALAGHDCGYGIIHLWFPPFPPPPVAAKLPLDIAFSKRKMMFSSSTVRAEDTQIGCSQLVGSPPLPMLTCGSPVPPPNSFPIFNFLNTVSVHLTVGDLIAGLVDLAMAMLADRINESKREDLYGRDLNRLAGKLLGAKNPKKLAMKMALGILTSGPRLAGTHETELKIEALSAYLGFKASIESKIDGRLSFSGQAQMVTGKGSVQGKGKITFANGGKTAVTCTSSSVGPTSARSTMTTETCDGMDPLLTRTTRTWGLSL